MWVRGQNRFGDLGVGNTDNITVAQKVASDAVTGTVYDSRAYYINDKHELFGSGMGSAPHTYYTQFTKIMDGVVAVGAGNSPVMKIGNNGLFHVEYTWVLKMDGSVWKWSDIDDPRPLNPACSDGSSPAAPSAIPAAPTSAPAPTPKPTASGSVTAVPTASACLISGNPVSFGAYNINGNNYFKLRDLAYALKDSSCMFDIGYDSTSNTITITNWQPYIPAGGEMALTDGSNKTAVPTTSKVVLDGKEVHLTAYNIDGANYFKLRDICDALNISVNYDQAANTIWIN